MPPKGKGGKGAKGKQQIYDATPTKFNKHHNQMYSMCFDCCTNIC